MRLPLLLALAAGPLAAGPVAAQPVTAQPVTAVDTVGREVALPARPARIVTTDVFSFGLLATLGVVPVGAVISPDHALNPYFYPAGTQIPDLGTDPWTPDLEKVAAADPDLILGWDAAANPGLTGLAPFFDVSGAGDRDDVVALARSVGALLGREAEAEAAVARFEDRLAAYRALVPEGERPDVLFLSTNAETFWIQTREDITCELIALLAACDWEAPDGGDWYEANVEGVFALQPDAILIEWYGEAAPEDALAELAKAPLWAELDAVRAGRAHVVPPSSLMSYSLPAFVQTLDVVATRIYPEAFPAPLTDEQVAAALAE